MRFYEVHGLIKSPRSGPGRPQMSLPKIGEAFGNRDHAAASRSGGASSPAPPAGPRFPIGDCEP